MNNRLFFLKWDVSVFMSTVCSCFGLFYFSYNAFQTSTVRKQGVIGWHLLTGFSHSRGWEQQVCRQNNMSIPSCFFGKHGPRAYMYVVRSQNKLILPFFFFFPFGVIWDTCWPDLNAFQRCYLKEHYVIVFNSQCSLLPMKNMVPFNGADRSISQGYAWACRGTTIKVGKMLLQTISNMYLSVESLAMIKGPVNSFLQERKVFLQRHQISPCHDKLPAPLAKRLREGRGCFGPWKCNRRTTTQETLDLFGNTFRGSGPLFSLCLQAAFVTLV